MIMSKSLTAFSDWLPNSQISRDTSSKISPRYLKIKIRTNFDIFSTKLKKNKKV